LTESSFFSALAQKKRHTIQQCPVKKLQVFSASSLVAAGLVAISPAGVILVDWH
jgi:hypothetical protein